MAGTASWVRRAAAYASEWLRPAYVLGRLYSGVVRWRLQRCGSGLRLQVTTVIRGHRNIVIGKNLNSMGHLYLYAHEGGAIRIGDDCSINTNVQIGAAAGRIVIGNGVMIASNVVLRAANHDIRRDRPMRYQNSQGGEIVVEDDVWIGSNSVVTADVTVARGTVVGAGAVVTRSTEPYSIVAGVPARKIGERPTLGLWHQVPVDVPGEACAD
jgi:acetyltransferase-like isoleucine patch superfamily enzyme